MTCAPGIVSGLCFSLPAPHRPGEAVGGGSESPAYAPCPAPRVQGSGALPTCLPRLGFLRAEQIKAALAGGRVDAKRTGQGREGMGPLQATGPWHQSLPLSCPGLPLAP